MKDDMLSNGSFSIQGTLIEKNKIKVEVYLDNGLVYEYFVDNVNKGREHAHAIIMTGYRHTTPQNNLEWFPPHRILKIRVEGAGESSNYKDFVRAT